MCKISVIMPVYNKVNYIEKAIQSIQDQTFTDWELIVIDDGSTDGSSEKCDAFQYDKRIKIFHVKNGGVSKARNLGLEKAIGEYVTFIDSDDYVGKSFLETIYIPEKEMIISGLKKVDSQGCILQEVVPMLSGEQTMKAVSKQFYGEQKKTGIYGFVCSKLVKRNIILEHNITFDEEIRLAEDYEFYLKIYSKIQSIFFLKDTSYFYLQKEDELKKTVDYGLDIYLSQIEIQKRTKQFLENKNAFGMEEKQIFLRSVTGYVYTILLMSTCKTYKEFYPLYCRLKKAVPETEKNSSGFQGVCIRLFEHEKSRALYWLLKLRALMRGKI